MKLKACIWITEQQKPFFFKKSPKTVISPTLKTTLEEKIASLQDRKWEFSLEYPQAWGEATSKPVAERETFQLGPDSNFSITVGPHFNPETREILSVEELTESVMKEGCQHSEISINEYRGFRISCERTRNSSEQAFIQVDENIYILYYRYDDGQVDPQEAKATFDFVFDSFKLL